MAPRGTLVTLGVLCLMGLVLATAGWIGQPVPVRGALTVGESSVRAPAPAHAPRLGTTRGLPQAETAPVGSGPAARVLVALDDGAAHRLPTEAPAPLAANTAKAIAKLEKKLAAWQAKQAAAQLKLNGFEAKASAAQLDIAQAQAAISQAELELALAEAMPTDTPEQKQAAKQAIKAAKKALKQAKKALAAAVKKLKKAKKKITKWSGKLATAQAKQIQILAKLAVLDPENYGGSVPVLLASSGVNAVSFSWEPVEGATAYTLYVSDQPQVDPASATALPGVTSPWQVSGLVPGEARYAVLTASVEGAEGPPSVEVWAAALSQPAAPAMLHATAVGGGITLVWDTQPDADTHTLYYSTQTGVTPANGTPLADVTSPFVHSGLSAGQAYHYVVTAANAAGESDPSPPASALFAAGNQYDPPWAEVPPLAVISLDLDPGLSATQNGDRLRQAVLALQPGDRLEVGGGTWSIAPKFSPSMQGTAQAPIFVVAKDGEVPVITRPDESQNLMNPAVEYVCFRGLQFTGGSAGIKIDASRHLWIDRCEIHETGDAGIAANSADTEFLYITRNHIHHTNGYGEGMYLGANNGARIMSNSIIALNHVHDTGGIQGDGIEIKQGSWGNWVAENHVHDTHYPCLLLYGTDGQPVNLVERNVLVGSDDNVLQVQGEAIVRNNLIANGANGFQSNDHQGDTRDLTFVHNTILNPGTAANLSSWNGRPGMVFANNVVYSQGGNSVRFSNGSSGVVLLGNVVFGSVVNVPASGYSTGSGLADFVDASWDGSKTDVTPSPGGALVGVADAAWMVDDDLHGEAREPPADAGCVEAP